MCRLHVLISQISGKGGGGGGGYRISIVREIDGGLYFYLHIISMVTMTPTLLTRRCLALVVISLVNDVFPSKLGNITGDYII